MFKGLLHLGHMSEFNNVLVILTVFTLLDSQCSFFKNANYSKSLGLAIFINRNWTSGLWRTIYWRKHRSWTHKAAYSTWAVWALHWFCETAHSMWYLLKNISWVLFPHQLLHNSNSYNLVFLFLHRNCISVTLDSWVEHRHSDRRFRHHQLCLNF